MARCLVQLYMRRRVLDYRVEKRVKKALAEGKDYVKLFFQENKCISGQCSWKKWYKASEVAKILGVYKRTLFNWEAAGKIPKAKRDPPEQLQVLYKRKY